MRKKILKVFFVILTGITVTLTGCELSGSNESAQTESESGKDAVKFIPNLTTAVTRKPTPTAVAANPGDSVQNQQSGNNAEAEIYQSQGDPADQESAQEETYDTQYITGNILYSDENTITVEVGESGNYYNMVFNIENAVLNMELLKCMDKLFVPQPATRSQQCKCKSWEALLKKEGLEECLAKMQYVAVNRGRI